MSSPAAVRKENFQSAILAGPESSSKLRISRSLPKLPYLCEKSPTAPSPALDSAKRAHTTEVSPEARGFLDPQHNPGPFALGASNDYLAKVKALTERVEPGLYEKLFDQNFVEGHGSVYIIGEPGMDPEIEALMTADKYYACFAHLDRYPWNDEKLQTLRKVISNAKEECPCVLIVEAIDKDGIQALGSVLHLDPVFLAHHIAGTLDDETYMKLKTACSMIAGESPAQDHQMHIEGRPGGILASEGQTVWPLTSPRRVHDGKDPMILISICRVASHTWLILVDPPLPTLDTTYAPFHECNQLSFRGFGCLPATYGFDWRGDVHGGIWQFQLAVCLRRALHYPARRQLLFELDERPHNDQNQASVLIAMTTVAAWQDNLYYISDQLKSARHDAIATPSMQTFNPLALLRRNIADLETSILYAKRKQPTEMKRDFDRRRKILGTKLPSLDDQYDALLQQLKDMSVTLNNEIQLVIGSVTVQDADVMKRQGRRATVLTLLASIYLPLSLVTSIFGMNIQEITKDGSNPVGRQAAVVFGVVAGATVLFFLLYLLWHYAHQRIRHLRRRGEEEVYKMA